MIDKFKEFLVQGNMAKNTIDAYIYAVNAFFAQHSVVNKKNLLAHKSFLIDKFKPKTVNLRIQALNKYLDFVGKRNFALSLLRCSNARILKTLSVMPTTFFEEETEAREQLGMVLRHSLSCCYRRSRERVNSV